MPIHVTTSTTQSLSNKTFVDRLSTTGLIYASGGNSNNWNAVYTTMQTNSGTWNSSLSSISNGSYSFSISSDGTFIAPNNNISTGNNAIQLLSNNSAAVTWQGPGGPSTDVISRVTASTGTVKATFIQGILGGVTTLKEFTLSSDGSFTFPDNTKQTTAFVGTALDTDVRSLTSNWQNTYTGFNSQSANNASVYSRVNSSSATWSNPLASSLSGTTLASNVVNSSLTNVGVLTSLSTSGLISCSYVGNADSSVIIAGANTKGGAGYHDFLRVTNTGQTNPNKFFRLNSTGGIEILNSAYTSVVFGITNDGVAQVAGAATANNDPTTNYISFNSASTVMYDDGNTHIHSRSSGGSMWINTNNGAIILGNQSPVNGGSRASAIIMGDSTTTKAYANIYSGKTYTIGAYGYIATIGAGTGSGTTATYGLYVDQRVQASEFDATSDERAKNIQGTIPLDQALKFVKQVDGILYTWNSDAVECADTGLKAGFGAQAVHKAGFDHMIGVIPNEKLKEQVDEDGWTHPEGMQLTMGYNQAIPYHHEVIKHLLERIEKLEAIVENLTSKTQL